ncbi:hypothetical protein PVAP13_9NG177073 [Panicum virgatum]|uniref:Uncharacterized protein n=1 Tax=Panicum virgatum TaxID=38727 RepID=A0A8T0MH14_PANVG|nr:hypothetical protein PVAP13_9NG177073 [Panicum virgatum]
MAGESPPRIALQRKRLSEKNAFHLKTAKREPGDLPPGAGSWSAGGSQLVRRGRDSEREGAEQSIAVAAAAAWHLRRAALGGWKLARCSAVGGEPGAGSEGGERRSDGPWWAGGAGQRAVSARRWTAATRAHRPAQRRGRRGQPGGARGGDRHRWAVGPKLRRPGTEPAAPSRARRRPARADAAPSRHRLSRPGGARPGGGGGLRRRPLYRAATVGLQAVIGHALPRPPPRSAPTRTSSPRPAYGGAPAAAAGPWRRG